jgi:hypothetical protein
MAILDLNAMARYGAYAKYLDFLNLGPIPFRKITFYGGTAEFSSPIKPVNSEIKAKRLSAFINAADGGKEKTEVRFSEPKPDEKIPYDGGKVPIEFIKRPNGGQLVNIEPDTNNKFKVQTNTADGATASSDYKPPVTYTFTFQPGAKAEFGYSTTTGVDVSYSVSEGVSKTASEGGSSTTTAGVELSGSFLGIGASASVEQSWSKEWSKSQTIDFSTNNEKTISKSTQISATIDLGSTQPNSEGKYFYGDVELVPGQKYQLSIIELMSTVKAPLTGSFVITPTAPNNATVGSKVNIGGQSFAPTMPMDATEAILLAYSQYNYDLLVQEQLADRAWRREINPSELYMEIRNGASFSASTEIIIQVRPVVEVQASSLVATDKLGLSSALPIKDSADGVSAQGNNQPERYIFLDDYNVDDGNPGVAFDVTTFADLARQRIIVNGTTEGGDYVTLAANDAELQNFTDSVFEVNDGYNRFNDAPGNGFNEYFLNGGTNTVYLKSDSNFIASQGGLSLIDIAAATRLDVDSGSGQEILKISDSKSEIAVKDWDFSNDILIFGEAIKLRDVNISYDNGLGDYLVSIGERVVAVLDAKDDSLPAFDSVTGQYQGTAVQPFAFGTEITRDFINTLYATALDRLPRASELKRSESDLQSGATRASVVESVLTSREFIADLTTDREYITAVYRTLLGKNPTPNQLRNSARRLDHGIQRKAFVESILNKDKFTDFFGQELSVLGEQETGIF